MVSQRYSRHSGSEDIMFLICRVILQGYKNQEQWDFLSKAAKYTSPPFQV